MKVLILHASSGAGHKRAAEALAKAFAIEDATIEVVVRDMLDFTGIAFKRAYGKGYLDLVRKAPDLWSFMFSQTDKKALLPSRKKIRAVFNQMNTLEFRAFCRDCNADAVICTHFMPLEVLTHLPERKKHGVPLYCVVTDFAVHALWIVDNVDRYYVATDESKRQMIRKGQPAERITISGIPVDPVFSQREPAESARKKLGIASGTPTILLLSGGYGVGPTTGLIRSFRDMKNGCQLLVVAGANEKLRKEAEAAAAGLAIPVKVFGFVNNIHELMDASDVVISKPGGLTTSEVLAKGKAMIVIDPIPGQEQRNCEYLLEAGAAMRLYDPEEAPHKVKTLLADPARLAQMQKNAKNLGHPFAARDIVKDLIAHARRKPVAQPKKKRKLLSSIKTRLAAQMRRSRRRG